MDVIGDGEPRRPPERFPRSHSLGDHGGHGEPREGEPGECGQDEEPDEQANGQEDDDSDSERGQIVAAGRAPSEHEHARTDVTEREQRCADDEQRPLGVAVGPDRKLVEDRDDEPEQEHAPEPALVEPDRVGDELPDGPVGR